MDKYVRKIGAGKKERDKGEEEKRGKESIAKKIAVDIQERQCKATIASTAKMSCSNGFSCQEMNSFVAVFCGMNADAYFSCKGAS
eukprot:1152443-Pelagomonas_calceolata.AAC.1